METVRVNVKDNIFKPVEEVFQAITDPEKLSGFFVSNTSGPVKQGETVTWNFTDAGVSVSVIFKKVIENKLISFEWPASGINARVDIMLDAESSDITAIEIKEDGGWGMDQEGVARAMGQTQGWTDFICSLKAFLYCGINLRKGRANNKYG